MADSWVTTIIGGGALSALGAVIGAVVNSASHRGESLAKAADAIVGSGAKVNEQFARLNERLDADNRQLRAAADKLVDVVSLLLDHAPALPADIAAAARAALVDARSKL